MQSSGATRLLSKAPGKPGPYSSPAPQGKAVPKRLGVAPPVRPVKPGQHVPKRWSGGMALRVISPCAKPDCTPENAQVPVYFCDLETNKNYCCVCWDDLEQQRKKIGLALSLEEMEAIGVTSFGSIAKESASEAVVVA